MSEWCRDLGDRDVGVTGSWGEIVTSVTCVTFSGLVVVSKSYTGRSWFLRLWAQGLLFHAKISLHCLLFIFIYFMVKQSILGQGTT